MASQAKVLSGVQVSECRVGEFPGIRLQNSELDVTVLPTLGGRIWSLRQKRTDVEWIWHRPGVPLSVASAGTAYDDHWAGGWEELFPNDAPGSFEGRELPDHGEWWSNPWDWEIVEATARRASIRLTRQGEVIRTECEKWLILESGASSLTLRYRSNWLA